MARPSSRAGDPIERLLQERNQYAQWLKRLEDTSDTAPAAVRGRIRADYQGRLEAVLEQLRQHADEIIDQLNRYRDSRAEFLTREAQAKEVMAEAEVRHAVGEYGDAKWQQIRGDAQRNLVAVREELARVTEEINELEKVQQLIAEPTAPEPVAPPPPPPPRPPAPTVARSPAPMPQAPRVAPKDEGEIFIPMADPAPPKPQPVVQRPPPSAVSTPPPPPPPPPPAPEQPVRPPAAASPQRPQVVRPPVKPKEKEGPPQAGRTLWFPQKEGEASKSGVDELAFLKSVSEDEQGGPSPRRASGGVPRPVEATATPAPGPVVSPTTTRAAPPPAPAPSVPRLTNANTFEASGPQVIPDLGGERASHQVAPRTLKCGECGTMNRPTEWYCERCGAELADL